MTQLTSTAAPAPSAAILLGSPASFGLLLGLRFRLLRNRLRQIVDQSPLRILLFILFLAFIWGALYAVFDFVFTFLRRYEQQAIVAIPLVFHVFVMAMTFLLAFSAGVLVYAALFARQEPSFLLATPASPRHIVTIMYLEALFFSSWSLVMLGMPLMLAIGHVQGLPWHFYLIFIAALLGFIPIPGSLGLVAAAAVATWLPRVAKRTVTIAGTIAFLAIVLWWGRLWGLSSADSNRWLQNFLAEMQYVKAALLPSTWVTNAIRYAIEDRPTDALFYLAVIASTAAFLSWSAVTFVGGRLLRAYASAQTTGSRRRAAEGRASRVLTHLLFFYLPPRTRWLVLKDVRGFLRDPAQWSQLVILLGLLGLYLVYLPRSRPEGFSRQWQALICFLNDGAVTLILSTFTSRFVFPLISMEGRQMWLVGLWPLPRSSVLRAKFYYALTITTLAALGVTALSIRALDLPFALAAVQIGAVVAACFGLCGLAVGLGARLPNFRETSAGRVASGLGGTINLIASVALVAISVGLFGVICYRLVRQEDLTMLDPASMGCFVAIFAMGLCTAWFAIRAGSRSFNHAQF